MKEQVNPMPLPQSPIKTVQTFVAPRLGLARGRQAKSLIRAVLAVLSLAAVALMAPAGLQAQAVSFNSAQTTVGTGLDAPYGVAVDGAGNLFIADYVNNRVVKVPANGGAQVSLLQGRLQQPKDVAVDGAAMSSSRIPGTTVW